MMKLGFNTAGTEPVFEQMLHKALIDRPTTTFGYLEIGVAEGTTLITVADWLRDRVKGGWEAIGIDLVDGPFFDARQYLRRSLSHEVEILFSGRFSPSIYPKHLGQIKIHLLKGQVRASIDRSSINFAVIDGCHGATCVEQDFLSIEQAIAPRGIVAFHDAGLREQGTHPQAHCGTPIAVKEALSNLQLDFVDCYRPGWHYLGMAVGEPDRQGHSFAFFQKIEQKGDS